VSDCTADDQDAADAAEEAARPFLALTLTNSAGPGYYATLIGQRAVHRSLTLPQDRTPVTSVGGHLARFTEAEARELQDNLAMLTGYYPQPTQPVPHDCGSCGTSMAKCDTLIRNRARACCGRCSITDTHGDTPSGYAQRERERQRLLAVDQGQPLARQEVEGPPRPYVGPEPHVAAIEDARRRR
jgi:hypothetical protein